VKALATLLRIAKRDLDLLRRALGEADGRLEMVARLTAHDSAVASEHRFALESYEGARAFGGFAYAAAGQRRAFEAQAHALEAEADRIRALVSEAHAEMKKLERLIEIEREREAEIARRAEIAALDELATMRAARKI